MKQIILFKVFKAVRATALTVGVAVMLAVLFGVASTAFAHKGDRGFFHLGHKNVSKAVSTLIKKGTGPALSLKVGAGQPPLAVNSPAKVARLNADRLDNLDSSTFMKAGQKAADSDRLDRIDSTGFYPAGSKVNDSDKLDNKDSSEFAAATHDHDDRYFTETESDGRYLSKTGKASDSDQLDGIDSTGFYRSGSKVADSDKLDNKDSTAFGIKTAHAMVLAHNCDTPSVWNECAPVTVTVPDGKNYIVSVWSSFSAMHIANFGNSQSVSYCSAGKGTSIDPGNPCITPFGIDNVVDVHTYTTAAPSSGDTLSMASGNYTFFTAIKPLENQFGGNSKGYVITKVMVRDATNGL